MEPVIEEEPQRGSDGFYRCGLCGTLMVRSAYYCPQCEREMAPEIKKGLVLVLLGLAAAVLIGLVFLE
jgi:hypothetical protein